MDSTSQPHWSSLPSDLLINIANILDARIDLLSLRAVCSPWRSSLPLPPKAPLLKLPFPIDPNNPNLNSNRHGHFALIESFSYSLEPINRDPKRTWLIKIQESESGNVILKDPLARYPLARYPLAGLDRLPKVLNLLDYRVKEISKGYYVEFVEQGRAPYPSIFVNEMKSCISIKQVAVSSSFDKIGDDGFVVLVIYNGGKLALWRMGDEKWSTVNDILEGHVYDSVAYSNGMFFAIAVDGLTISIDPSKASFEIMEVAPAKPRSGFGHGDTFKYLVKWFSDLFLIEKYHEDLFYWSESDDEDDYHIKFKIYKMNDENVVLFLGDACSFFVWAKDYAWWKGNCICFLDYLFMGSGSDGPGRLSKFSSCSKLFWPPPSWLKHYS
ncbi:F-box protein [Salix suchowensis]|nr:F-box protein [Salix suchowensis]